MSERIYLLCLFALWVLPGCNGGGGTGGDASSSDVGADIAADSGGAMECSLAPDAEVPDWLETLGCETDFEAIASAPLDASIPGATSVKTVIDQLDPEGDALYFQNSQKYLIHWDFTHTHLSGAGMPLVPALSQFNQTEYYSPTRRFLLGAVTFYEGPDKWVYEIAPYDTASAEMIEKAYGIIRDAAFFGSELYFHPTSLQIELESEKLSDAVLVISTDELFEGIIYQPLNLGVSLGRLRHMSADELETEYVDFREIVVLDSVPNDISVVAGIITSTFQTPLSHINVLSQNRGTPNMALIGVYEDGTLQDLDGKWVRLTVGAFEYSVEEVTQEEADAWWEENKPEPVEIQAPDLSVVDLRDIEAVLDLAALDLGPALKKAIPAFGGKASHYGGIALIGEDCPVPKAFGIPIYFYDQFMEENGFWDEVDTLLSDPSFLADPATRDARLEELRDAMEVAPVNEVFESALMAKLANDYPDVRMRFRSSTNAEDLDGFTGAGLYTSKSGDTNDPDKPVLDAVREVWASIWFFRAYEERAYRSIDHTKVGMALLVHRSFPDEEANGVALTGNIFDTTGLEPGFYVNVQKGELSVVKPEVGVTTDQFIYHFDMPGQPIVFLDHSNQVEEGETVLTIEQTYELGKALKAIHLYFFDLYGPPPENPLQFYGMDTEFKFDGEPGEEPALFVKQARPHPGWGG